VAASASWHPEHPALDDADLLLAALSAELQDSSNRISKLLVRATRAARANWSILARSWQPRSVGLPESWFHPESGLVSNIYERKTSEHVRALGAILDSTREASAALKKCRADPLLVREIHVGLLGLRVMEELYIIYHKRAGRRVRLRLSAPQVAGRVRQLRKDLRAVWLRRNRASELHRIEAVLEAVESDLVTSRQKAVARTRSKSNRRPR
jgi:hypothetical protein